MKNGMKTNHAAAISASEFGKADLDGDGRLSRHEFLAWYLKKEAASSGVNEGSIPKITGKQLWVLFIAGAVPFIGFGFMDNAIMLTAGDLIEDNLGVAFGISTLAAAGLGNLLSDVAGLGMSGAIESGAAKMGVPVPTLSAAQMKTTTARRVIFMSSSVGISIGCLLGLLPLLFMESDPVEEVFKDIGSQSLDT